MEPEWLTYAKRLNAIALTGLHYSTEQFDRERFEEVASIACEMMAKLASVPVERIKALVAEDERGYMTPKVDVRGAVIQNDAILLVRERRDGLWTLPGGFADVGRSAAKNVEKEVLEEAGLAVAAKRLFLVRHKAGGSYAPEVRDFYKMFYLCESLEDKAPCAGPETSDARYFKRNELPSLSTGRTIESDIEAAFSFAADPHRQTLFD